MSEIFHSLVLNKRFDDATLRVLESALVSKDVKSSIEVRSGLRQFLGSESLSVLREISEKSAEEKLLVLEFLVRSFALVGDVESCLALRYEALLLRDLKSATNPWLQVPYTEWLNFAHQSKDSGFYSVAGRACENALVCFKRKCAEDPKTDEVYVMKKSTEDAKADGVFENVQVIEQIKRLKDCAMASASSHSGTQMAFSSRLNFRAKGQKELPIHQRGDAVSSLVYEANARVRDPVYGCVGAISFLQNQVSQLQMQLAVAQAEILCIQMQQEPVALPNQIDHQHNHHHQDHDHDQKSLLLSNSDFNNIPHQYFSSFASSSNVIQDPLKRESLWT
ncbi:protein DOUBLE-STRAND BREAK FORMATION-like isoform X2 [Prunus dulcis]|uniref:protein DOUBLE-STRAND BREAK FORMATION-like isoform X2 n=1 Tax=Prunus dulcis TaxID=3755 RepID=UPI0014825597|nr:protein DOUBLE-STRAND BREAK FORMATION-like isoform X2 [Prunus dulcis]